MGKKGEDLGIQIAKQANGEVAAPEPFFILQVKGCKPR